MNYSYSPDTAKVLLSVLLGSVGLFLLLAISSYSPFDPGWTYTSSDTKQIANLGGMVGAWFADLLRAGLGWASFFVPFYLFYEIWQLWRPRTVLPRVLRYFAQAFMVVMLASIFALVRSQHSLNYAGGVIGYEVSSAIAQVFTIYGAGLLFTLLFILACNLIFVINWKGIWFNTKLAIDFMKDTLYRTETKHIESSNTPSASSTTAHYTELDETTLDSSNIEQQAIVSASIHESQVSYLTDDVGYRANTAQTHLQEIQQLLAESKTQRHFIKEEHRQAMAKMAESTTQTTNNHAHPIAHQSLESTIQTTNSNKTNWQDEQAFDRLLHDLDEQIQVSSSNVYQKANTDDIDRRIHELNQQIEALQQAQVNIQQQQYSHQHTVQSIQDNVASTHTTMNVESAPVDMTTNALSMADTTIASDVPQETIHHQHETIDLAKVKAQAQQQAEEEKIALATAEQPVKKESKIQNLLDKVLAKRAKAKAEHEETATAKTEEVATNPFASHTVDDVTIQTNSTVDDINTPHIDAQHLENDFLLQHQQLQQRLKHNPLQDLEQMLLLADAGKVKKTSSSTHTSKIDTIPESYEFTSSTTVEPTSNHFATSTTLMDDIAPSYQAKTVNPTPSIKSYNDDIDDLMVEKPSYQASQQTKIHIDVPTARQTLLNDDLDDDDWDAPLTDAHGRIVSRAMQVAQHRKNLPTLPSLDLLDKVDANKKVSFNEEQLGYLSQLLELKLQDFNVKAQVKEVQPGPVVTRFALELAPGVKASKVTGIAQDLARSMSMSSIRVVQVIPGKPYIGIEVPNSTREMVRLIELVDTPEFRDPNALLSMAMGKDIAGHPVLTDLAKAPHMLVAGTTGSGKSVAVNSMLLSMLLKYTPQQLRLLLIDPKQLELANYDEIPHLLTPVVTDMKDATNALHWCVKEMERRYSLMTAFKVRKINDFNAKITQAIENGEDIIDPLWKPENGILERAPRLEPLPMIVIVADEFADMIMQVGKKAEEMITRLAQKSRAAGIHLLLATQRPSVDVITGLIKANIPTRVALRVNSKIDSRTILDAGGAEDLLGHGDMLFLAPGKNEPERLHGAFIADDEVNRICDAWRERGSPDYVADILDSDEDDEKSSNQSFDDEQIQDVLYDKAVEFVLRTRKASASSLQRQFNIGFNRAANLMDAMERNGIVSESQGSNRREILV